VTGPAGDAPRVARWTDPGPGHWRAALPGDHPVRVALADADTGRPLGAVDVPALVDGPDGPARLAEVQVDVRARYLPDGGWMDLTVEVGE